MKTSEVSFNLHTTWYLTHLVYSYNQRASIEDDATIKLWRIWALCQTSTKKILNKKPRIFSSIEQMSQYTTIHCQDGLRACPTVVKRSHEHPDGIELVIVSLLHQDADLTAEVIASSVLALLMSRSKGEWGGGGMLHFTIMPIKTNFWVESIRLCADGIVEITRNYQFSFPRTSRRRRSIFPDRKYWALAWADSLSSSSRFTLTTVYQYPNPIFRSGK